jgi:hypothetical protein
LTLPKQKPACRVAHAVYEFIAAGRALRRQSGVQVDWQEFPGDAAVAGAGEGGYWGLIARFQQEHLHATECRFRGYRNDFDQIGKAKCRLGGGITS